ncbi:hypothetical protein C8J56DRAFT_1065211 [Mycena floridula]|nr:hypothetical protein C8J56DRAFT_1065211 [Mycena floridula]
MNANQSCTRYPFATYAWPPTRQSFVGYTEHTDGHQREVRSRDFNADLQLSVVQLGMVWGLSSVVRADQAKQLGSAASHPSDERKVTLSEWFEASTDYYLFTQFRDLHSLELQGPLEAFGDQRARIRQVHLPTINVQSFPTSLAHSLRHLQLCDLHSDTLARFVTWVLSKDNQIPPITHLQLTLIETDHFVLLLPVLQRLSSSLSSLGILISDPHPTGVRQLTSFIAVTVTSDSAIVLPELRSLRLQVSEYVLGMTLCSIQWTFLDTLDLDIRYESSWTYPEYVLVDGESVFANHFCRLKSPNFQCRFPFAHLETQNARSTVNLNLYCPCSGFHAELLHKRYQGCASRVDFHDFMFCLDNSTSGWGKDEGIAGWGSDHSDGQENEAEADALSESGNQVAGITIENTEEVEGEAESADAIEEREVVDVEINSENGWNTGGGFNSQDSPAKSSRLIPWSKPVVRWEHLTWHRASPEAHSLAVSNGQCRIDDRAWILEYECDELYHACHNLRAYERQHPHECGKALFAQRTLHDYFS